MKTVIVIESRQLLQGIYTKLLKRYNLQPISCCTATEAEDYINNQTVDLIIAGQEPANSNNLALLRLTKMWKEKIPMIVISSNNKVRDKHPDVDLLVNQIMFKPYSNSELEANLDQLFKALSTNW